MFHRTHLPLKKPGLSSPLTKAQADSVLTREDLPASHSIVVTLVILTILLLAAYIYYSNINP